MKRYKVLNVERFVTLEGDAYDLYGYRLYSEVYEPMADCTRKQWEPEDEYKLTLVPVAVNGHSSNTDPDAVDIKKLTYDEYIDIVCTCMCYVITNADLVDFGFVTISDED